MPHNLGFHVLGVSINGDYMTKGVVQANFWDTMLLSELCWCSMMSYAHYPVRLPDLDLVPLANVA
jgi:hypothetical protein